MNRYSARYSGINRLKDQLIKKLQPIFRHPAAKPVKKVAITISGLLVTLLGVVLIILPGPAFLLIPIGLAILALEYPIARKWLRKFQTLLTAWARKADDFWTRKKANL